MRKKQIIAKVLPRDAVVLLQTAAQTPLVPYAPEPDLWRRAAIDQVTLQIRRTYPNLFIKE